MNSQETRPEVTEQEIALVTNNTGSSVITINETGWDSRVYSVDGGEYFFKFPRSQKIQTRYPQEIAALNIAKQTHLVHVPEVLWEDSEHRFFGYRGVPGTLLDDLLPTLSNQQKKHVGNAIGRFLAVFHPQTFPGVRTKTIEDEIAQLLEWYQPAVPILQDAYSGAEFAAIDTLVRHAWPARMQELGYAAALCHGDLHLSNMLIDTDASLGIIDFGDVAQYDESKDFIDLGDPIIEEAAIRAYGDSGLLREKIAVRKRAVRIISLTYHIKKQNDTDVRKYLDLIRQDL